MLIKNIVETRPAVSAAPISLSDLKDHLRLFGDNTVSDTYLNNLITAATDIASAMLGEAVTTTEYYAYFTDFSDLRLPIDFVDTIDAVQYYAGTATGNTYTTVATSVYYLDNTGEDPEVKLLSGQEWPENINTAVAAPVRITYTGDVATAGRSRAIHQAVLIIAADMYENPNSMTDKAQYKVSFSAERLLKPYRRQTW